MKIFSDFKTHNKVYVNKLKYFKYKFFGDINLIWKIILLLKT